MDNILFLPFFDILILCVHHRYSCLLTFVLLVYLSVSYILLSLAGFITSVLLFRCRFRLCGDASLLNCPFLDSDKPPHHLLDPLACLFVVYRK
ncbi:hypothetical protein Sjap_026168 [Stephania japonica]|uniref:Uncharacterized protein n=1 Tax=Stephania japonica TaxID=461633 RepID=A0AAP0E7G9_9MAGN